jgi:hypothetical protein
VVEVAEASRYRKKRFERTKAIERAVKSYVRGVDFYSMPLWVSAPSQDQRAEVHSRTAVLTQTAQSGPVGRSRALPQSVGQSDQYGRLELEWCCSHSALILSCSKRRAHWLH